MGVMTVAGLVSAVLIALAVTATRLVGKSMSAVSVRGLVLSTALVVGAAVLQVVTVGLSAVHLVDQSFVVFAPALLTLVVVITVMVYAQRLLSETLTNGVDTKVPAIPPDVLVVGVLRMSSASGEGGEQRIKNAFAEWLEPESQPNCDFGTAAMARPPKLNLDGRRRLGPPCPSSGDVATECETASRS